MIGHMDPEEFRRCGYAAIDWIAAYWETLEQRPVQAQTAPGAIAKELPAHPPERGEDLIAVLGDLDRCVVPGLTHWQHPGFFGYFPANTSGPSIIGDLICSGIGVQGMLWATSPAATEVETVVLDWLAELLDLPAAFRSTGTGGGVIQDSASSATLVATLAAVQRASGGHWRNTGVAGSAGTTGAAGAAGSAGAAGAAGGAGRRYAVYTSSQGHSSIEKAARIAGLGDDAVRLLDVDPVTMALRPAALRAALEADRTAGITPALIVATVGTTSTTAIDPLAEIGPIAREYGAWLHVDAAYAGAAAVCPELRWIHKGLEYADSYCFDPHKWLLTGFDCDAFWVADRAALVDTLTIVPEYLRNAATEAGAVIDYRDWQVPLGRRFRALKLWFVLRWYGAEGLRSHIRQGIALAEQLAELIGADHRFEIVTPHPLSLLCFRLRDAACQHLLGDDAPPTALEELADRINEQLERAVNAEGTCLLSHTKVADRYVLRAAIGAPTSQQRHVAAAWRTITAAADILLAPGGQSSPRGPASACCHSSPGGQLAPGDQSSSGDPASTGAQSSLAGEDR